MMRSDKSKPYLTIPNNTKLGITETFMKLEDPDFLGNISGQRTHTK